MKTTLRAAFVTTLAAGFLNSAFAATPIAICDDDEGWPPYMFADPKDTEKDLSKKKVTGANTEIIVEVLKRAGYEPQISLLPWKRCLAEVESGKIPMLMNAAANDERKAKYLLSKPLYTINGGVFYMAGKKPNIKSDADLKNYKYCGRAGFNYKMYTTIPESAIDSGARGAEAQYKKLRENRCDLTLDDIEIAKGYAGMGTLDLKGIESMPVPGAKPKEFHALITKAESGGEKLLKVIDDGIEKLKKDGTYAKIYKKYGI